MLGCFFAIIGMCIFILYQFIAYHNLDMVFVSLFKGQGFVLSFIQGVCIKWSLVVGLIGLVYSIVSIALSSKYQDKDFGKAYIGILIFYIIFTFGIIF